MPRTSPRRLAVACLGACLICGAPCPGPLAHRAARADQAAPKLAVRHDSSHPTVDHRRPGGSSGAGGGWWAGTAGVALAIAVLGGVSLASRRFLPRHAAGPLEVVGRASLSPKHAVYLLRAGDRILIVGAGSQGPPALLGEWSGPIDRDRGREASTRRAPIAPSGPGRPVGGQA